jgi:Ca2+-transporting ATPase
MLFAVLAFGQIFQTLAARSWYESPFACSFRSQFVVIGSLALTVASTLAIIYLPFLQDVFGTTSLNPGHLLASLILSSSVFWSIEFEKLIKRRRRKSVS